MDFISFKKKHQRCHMRYIFPILIFVHTVIQVNVTMIHINIWYPLLLQDQCSMHMDKNAL